MGKRLEELTVVELKDRLRQKQLPVSGKKSELISRLKSGPSVPDNVLDKQLYLKIRNQVKQRVKAWPSAYASGQVVKEYKAAGGRYSGEKPSKKEASLSRWFEEEWVDLCRPKKGGGYQPCGRKDTSMSRKEFIKTYPYCRPMNKVTKSTPKTVSQLSKDEIEKRCQQKRKNPKTKVTE